MSMRIGVMGLGVVGQAVARVMAAAHEVFGYDLKFGRLPSKLPVSRLVLPITGVDQEVDPAKVSATCSTTSLLATDLVFICTPTPMVASDTVEGCGPHDPRSVLDCCEWLAEHGYLGPIVIKSTLLPQAVELAYERVWRASDGQARLVTCPEFLNARSAYEDMKNASHLVLGGDKASTNLVFEAHKQALPGIEPLFFDDLKSPMVVKYATNGFFAVKNAFFNLMYEMCAHLWGQDQEVEFQKIRSAVVRDPRIHPVHTDVPGYDGLRGFGGACLPKDLAALRHQVFSLGLHNTGAHILVAAEHYNRHLREPEDG